MNSFRNLVLAFVDLQEQLVRAFRSKYPEPKDEEWLLDFPAGGTVKVEGADWGFTKHGAGMRFVRGNLTLPRLVVDVHNQFTNPRIVDVWRLSQFVDSRAESMTNEEISQLLNSMCKAGELIDIGSGKYVLAHA